MTKFVLGCAVLSWLTSLFIIGGPCLIENVWPKKTWSRWMLAAIFLGWAMLPVLIAIGARRLVREIVSSVRNLWRDADLPVSSLRSEDSQRSAGELSISSSTGGDLSLSHNGSADEIARLMQERKK